MGTHNMTQVPEFNPGTCLLMKCDAIAYFLKKRLYRPVKP